jgi:uncharacterized protein YbjT (DUF2867 family)
MRILLLGATGLVGSHVLGLALRDAKVEDVIAPVRRPIAEHSGLRAPIVDFENLDERPDLWACDAVICCLGTTIKVAGSREKFYRVDHDYPVEIAHRAHRAGASTFVLNSAKGAGEKSSIFYSRVKGEIERDILAVGFDSTVIVRPGLIDGERREPRPVERAGILFSRALAPLLPRGLRLNPAANIAKAMLGAALSPPPGVTVVSSEELA